MRDKDAQMLIAKAIQQKDEWLAHKISTLEAE
jgi:hypothetical protein